MNILHTVHSYLPARHGMTEQVSQISERLVRRGHRVVVATGRQPDRIEKVINGVEVVEFDVSGNLVKGMQGEVGKYRDFLVNSKFDVVVNFHPLQWSTDIMLPLLGEIKGIKILAPIGFSVLWNPRFKDYFEQMKTWLKQYDASLYQSAKYQDAVFARECGANNPVLIFNGASEEDFLAPIQTSVRKIFGIDDGAFLILHVGGFTGIKGQAEALEIFRHAKLKNSILLMLAPEFNKNQLEGWYQPATFLRLALKIIKGYKPATVDLETLYLFSALFNLIGRPRKKNIILASLPRKGVIDSLHAADLFLFPSRTESSPIVLYECLAAKTPFFSTDVGVAVELSEWSGSGWIMPTERASNPAFRRPKIKDTVRMLEEMVENPELLHQMAESGFKAWEERFTWEKISLEYEKLYTCLVNGEPLDGLELI